jgi:serine/threonine protein kinase
VYIEENDAWSIIIKVMRGLRAIHQAGLIHGNIRPSNVMTFEGEVYLTDEKFTHPFIIIDKETFKTPGFHPPEFISLETVSQKSDVWACGVLLYQMIAQKLPFTETHMKQMIQDMKSRDKSTKRYWPPLPKEYSKCLEIADLIDYLLYPDMENRPTIEDVLNSKII